jgi:hypothetical protein
MGGAASAEDAFSNSGAGLTGPEAPSQADRVEIQAEPTAAPAASGDPEVALQPPQNDAAGTLLATEDGDDRTAAPLVFVSMIVLLAGVGLLLGRLLGRRLSCAP